MLEAFLYSASITLAGEILSAQAFLASLWVLFIQQLAALIEANPHALWAAQQILFVSAISCGGWLWETILAFFMFHEIKKRGMLIGPTCPIYGVGAWLMWMALSSISEPWLVFIAGALIATILEYSVSVLLEKKFQRRWWDYSPFAFNVEGRICLGASCVFGLFAIVVVFLLGPALFGFLSTISPVKICVLAAVLVGIYTLDVSLTLAILEEKLTPSQGTFARILVRHVNRQ